METMFKKVMRLAVFSVVLLAVISAVHGKRNTSPQRIQCPEVCPFNYQPVCGSDGKTYSNECSLLSASCRAAGYTINKIANGKCGALDDCPNFCSLNYDPVCGSDGKMYSNDCFLKIAICHNPFITKAGRGPCQTFPEVPKIKCPIGCPKIANPVCGNDGKTYSNECTLRMVTCKNSAVKLDYAGSCVKCPRRCPKHYKPVCGSNGKTYANKCLLNIASCIDDSVKFHHGGRC